MKHGFSKDHRPDLKQVMLSMICSGPANLPIWAEPQDGNSSDKKTFHETIEAVRCFQQELKAQKDFMWVADSAFYSIEKLKNYDCVKWISRVPETLSACKEILKREDDDFDWKQGETAGYRYCEIKEEQGGVKQRWLVVSSSEAYQRESKTFEQKLLRIKEHLVKSCWHLSHEVFHCTSDAQEALMKLAQKQKFFDLNGRISAIEKYPSIGTHNRNAKASYCSEFRASP